jgi:hypothetical protein
LRTSRAPGFQAADATPLIVEAPGAEKLMSRSAGLFVNKRNNPFDMRISTAGRRCEPAAHAAPSIQADAIF